MQKRPHKNIREPQEELTPFHIQIFKHRYYITFVLKFQYFSTKFLKIVYKKTQTTIYCGFNLEIANPSSVLTLRSIHLSP